MPIPVVAQPLPVLAHRARGAAARAVATSPVGRSLGIGEVIYLIAPSGHPNYGDELIARTWLRHLARVRPRATVVLDCHSPGQAALLLGGIHPRAVFVDTLWRLTSFAAGHDTPAPDTSEPDEKLDPAEPWHWVAHVATDPGRAPKLADGIDLLVRASTIHLLGGGYINTVWPHHVSLVAAAAAVADATGARAVATGQGLIPHLEGPAWSALRTAAGSFTVFDVRDAASAEALGEVTSKRNTGDDAWLALHRPLWNLLRRKATAGRRGVVLCLQSDLTDKFRGPAGTGVTALTDFVRATLDAWEVPGSDITVIEGIPGHDNEVPHRLGDRLDGATRIPFREVWRLGLPAGDGATWISTRFHPHLLAAAAGDPGVAIVPMPVYYSTKHRSLLDAGSRWSLVDDGTAIPARPAAGGFDEAHRQRAVATKLALAQEIYPESSRKSLRRG